AVRLLDRVAVLPGLAPVVRLLLDPAGRVRHVADVLFAHRVAPLPSLAPDVLLLDHAAGGVRDVAHLLLAHVGALLPRLVLDVLFGDDPARRVRDVAHLLLRDRVAHLPGHVLDALLLLHAAGRVGDVADVFLRDRVAPVPGLAPDLLLRHLPASRVALLAVGGVALGPADRHLHRVRVRLAHLLADLDLPHFLLRHPHLLARPGARALNLLGNGLPLAVARLAGARVHDPRAGGLAAPGDDRAR